jgi:mannitol-1-phosphate 5-dehydrogenase
MNNTRSKQVMAHKSILIFGGGKIGRSFIGQLFGRAGYEVIFSDVDKTLIDELNRRGEYPVVIKGDAEETLIVPNVRAIFGTEENVVREVAHVSIMAVSVGKNVLGKIIPLIAKGLLQRRQEHPDSPVNIIIAENMRSAATFMREGLSEHLPADYPLDRLVGLVETSIGKMVPIMTKEDLAKDSLAVFAEPYNSLIVDKRGFVGEIPVVVGLAPKSNIQAWVDRKAFIHNLGHATAAYYGAFRHPEAVYMYEALSDSDVLDFTRSVMLQSATVLQAVYPADFTISDLEAHTDDLLYRFRNKALKDTIFRVGQDRIRKLGPDDRFVGIVRLAQQQGMDYNKVLQAMSYAFTFKATDENGNRPESDILFDQLLEQGVEVVLEKVCGFDTIKDEVIKKSLIREYQGFLH